MTNHLTIDKVLPYIWPHVDFGKSQNCAKIMGRLNHNHGDIIELPDGRKGVFRLLDAGLYRDDWMKEALPLAKKYWEQKRSEYPDDK